ncbi:protein-L-isoaspartate(D-aspartate) O-methyltransferase [Hydrogenimonas sp.]|uniref:protein-L-isoaspartate(D-aspartate) O-methyltransferase n=1 Tax=Hydrogenimonas sp. TaxID=2231112 RepID=UPI002612BBDE|nr:protein-L-isoaspartate(D-aspartate) O-methyltransferase [Hydrogenimonas sp.]
MRYVATPIMFLILIIQTSLSAETVDPYIKMHKRMVTIIQREVESTRGYLGREKLDPKVVEALLSVKRHLFVPPRLRGVAYENRPLPIGYGQTISQPYMVAVMTDLLEPKKSDIVLEVGTGSGYQAAVLASIVKKVYTLEIIEPLGLQAKKRLERLGYDNVEVRIADGYYGLEEKAPFDKIIVTAAAGHVPPPLIRQLKPGGIMVIPVGGPFFVQHLVLLKKEKNGAVSTRQIMPVSFVPLTGRH